MSQKINGDSVSNEIFVPWTDYAASSTIVGWTTPTAYIYYKKIGKLVFVQIEFLATTSNSTTTSFTIPYTPSFISSRSVRFPIQFTNNGNTSPYPGVGKILDGSTTVSLFTDFAEATWTASGNKGLNGEFWYEATT